MKPLINKLKLLWIRHHNVLIWGIFLFIFPLIVGWIYSLPLLQVINVASGDLLLYYATAFGIFGSFFTYRHEVERTKREKINRLKPRISVIVKKSDTHKDLFEITLRNDSEGTVLYLYLFDEFIRQVVEKKEEVFKVTFCKSTEANERLKPDLAFQLSEDDIDDEGYPKYVQIICDDEEGNTWECDYLRVREGNTHYYYPREIRIIS